MARQLLSMKITGGEQLARNLRAFKTATQRRKLRRALMAAAKPIAEEMERRAWRLTGKTAESITIQTVRGSDATVGVGPSKRRAFLARFNEFGTSRQPARPRLRPAFESKAREALVVFADAMRRELERKARRLPKGTR